MLTFQNFFKLTSVSMFLLAFVAYFNGQFVLEFTCLLALLITFTGVVKTSKINFFMFKGVKNV